MAIGVPGCPDFAACTASIASVRMVLMVRRSRSLADMTRIRSGVAISASPASLIRIAGDADEMIIMMKNVEYIVKSRNAVV